MQDRFSGVDRGGVEPLERGDKFAPGAGRTRPSSTMLLYQNMGQKRKAPLRELLGVGRLSIKADSSPCG